MDESFDRVSAEAAESRGDWATAIALVSDFAECPSKPREAATARIPDDYRHDAHLWHMRLLVKAGLMHELAELAETDVHARRRLDRALHEQGRDVELRQRACRGDKFALYLLVHLLRARGDHGAARQAVADIDRSNAYAVRLAEEALPEG